MISQKEIDLMEQVVAAARAEHSRTGDHNESGNKIVEWGYFNGLEHALMQLSALRSRCDLPHRFDETGLCKNRECGAFTTQCNDCGSIPCNCTNVAN